MEDIPKGFVIFAAVLCIISFTFGFGAQNYLSDDSHEITLVFKSEFENETKVTARVIVTEGDGPIVITDVITVNVTKNE